MIKLAVFDLDGTIVNSIYDLADAVNDGLIRMGLPVHDLDEYYRFVGNGTLKLCERALPENNRSDDEVKTLHNIFAENYRQCCLNKTRPYDGITDMLRVLKNLGIKLAVGTNKTDSFAKHIVSTIFGEDMFDAVLGKRDGIPGKPDPQIIFDITALLDVDNSEVIFVGDSDVDVRTAHNAGVRCIGCEWGFRGLSELKNAGADFIALSPDDIISFISR
ncbi:MAG: HAD family hydrolase [Ruminococcus sp.]|nr:HAD family hydrolase [Ruminococcus sp.]